LTPAKNMYVQVIHALRGIRAIVDHKAEAPGTVILANLGGLHHQMAKERLVTLSISSALYRIADLR